MMDHSGRARKMFGPRIVEPWIQTAAREFAEVEREARNQERARCAAEIRRCLCDGIAWDAQRAEADAKRIEKLPEEA